MSVNTYAKGAVSGWKKSFFHPDVENAGRAPREGCVTYRWMEGGYFLLQDVRLEQFGQVTTGIEVIGNLRPFGEEPSADVHSRYYDNTGATLDYVYELDGDTLTIWGGEKGSPVKFVGTFDETGDVMTGEWDYAGQGGYESTMTRV